METKDTAQAKEYMGEYPDTLEEEQNLPTTLIIKDFNNYFLRTDIRVVNTFGDFRKLCLTIPCLSFVTNYNLVIEKNNAICDDSDPIANYQLNDFDVIKMVPCMYNKSTAKIHVEVLKYILFENPPFINKFTERSQVIYKDIETLINNTKEDHEKTKQFVKEYQEEMSNRRRNLVDGKDASAEKKDAAVVEENKNEESENRTVTTNETTVNTSTSTSTNTNANTNANANANVSASSNVNTPVTATTTENKDAKDSAQASTANTAKGKEKEKKKTEAELLEEEEKFKKEFQEKVEEGFKTLKEIKEKVLEIDFKKFSLSNLQNSTLFEDQAKPQKIRCLNSIYYSHFNQELDKLSTETGYLYFLVVNTLEGVEYHITATERGFYVNQSTSFKFNPLPAHPISQSYTLAGLLCLVSTQFKDNFSKLMTQVLTVDPVFFLPTPNHRYDWLQPNDNSYFYNYIHKLGDNINELHEGKKPSREWNEELQAVFDLKIPSNIENLQKEKLLNSLYTSFKESAIEGAKLVIEKQLQPVTFFETPNKGLFIYNNIFLTILEDSYLDFKTFNNTNVTQTFLGAGIDLKHLNFINKNMHEYNFNNFYFSMTCNVHYRGQRVQAQIIIPGIIFNSESMIEYGQIEEGSIKYSEDFCNDIRKFYEKLGVEENIVLDKEGKEFKYAGHPEIKGVRGIDRRKYLFDLIHILPRDLNYPGPENLGCILRPELLAIFKYKTTEEKLQAKYSKDFDLFNKDLDDLNKNHEKVPNYKKSLEDLLLKRKELYDRIRTEASSEIVKFNNCLHTNVKFSDKEKEKLERDEKVLIDLSKFLKENMIDEYLKRYTLIKEDMPCDSKSLSDSIHRYGINVRYFGEIISRIEKNAKSDRNLSWLKTLIIRDVIIRAAAHIFDSLVKNIPSHLTSYFISYFLNILLGSPKTISLLEGYDVTYTGEGIKLDITSTSNSIQGKSKVEESKEKEKKSKNADKHKKKKDKKKLKKDKEYEYKSLFLDTINNTFLGKLIDYEQINELFIKPSSLWSQVKEIAAKRYGYVIPNNNSYEYISSISNKFGMLRDFCQRVGLQIEAKDYNFYPDPSLFVNGLKYEYLTFQPQNVTSLYPIVKETELPSEITRNVLEQAEALFNSGNYIHAMEKFNQTALIYEEIHGPINKITAHAYRRLAIVCYVTGDVINAIFNVQKAIAIFEKNLDYDSYIVSVCYSDLAQYYQADNQSFFAFKALYKSLELLMFTVPHNHPEIAIRLHSISILYGDLDICDHARDFLESSVKTSYYYYEDLDPNFAKSYLELCVLSHKNKSINKCVQYYDKYHKILKNYNKDNKDSEKMIKESEKILEGLKIAQDEFKKKQSTMKNHDPKKLYDEICRKHISNLLTFEDKMNIYASNYYDNLRLEKFKEKEKEKETSA